MGINGFKAIIFDFDGVILDSIPIHDEAYFEVFRRHGIRVELDHLHSTIGMTAKQALAKNFQEQAVEIDIERVTEEFYTILTDLFQREAKMPPYLDKFLEDCKQKNLKIGLASASNSEILKMVIQKFGIFQYFEAIVGGEEIEKGKPDPEMIQRALAKLGADPRESLAIDDAPSGILAAKSLGMYAIAYVPFSKKTIEEADLTVNSFEEINLEVIFQTIKVQ